MSEVATLKSYVSSLVTFHFHLLQVKKELLPCLRSFTSSLRVAELVWKEGTLIKDYPPEAYK